ncbi:MAG TPA: glycerophosphodiester phosphodiesterase [Planctomycetaceae bacterium]|nr:glycerophosphodiester phosphodiesterase [Planctomycetaceae bacterium]
MRSVRSLAASIVMSAAFIALAALSAAVIRAESTQPTLPSRGISAHRGACSTHPENTLAAFREAIHLGVHQIELDVQLLADGGLAVIHDSTVDRTTDGRGRVAQFTVEKIKKLDAGAWKDPKFAGQRVPLLAEALEIMPRNVWINVHLKGGKELGAAVAREIVRQNRTHQTFMACNREAADAAREVCPTILICNMQRPKTVAQYVHETMERRCRFIQFAHKLGTPDEIRRLKEAGVSINFYGVNDADEISRLFDAGVDFPLVDDVAEMLRVTGRLDIEPLKPVVEAPPNEGVSEPR